MKFLSHYFGKSFKKSKLTFDSKVSPAKMALRRHLSQERLTPQQSSSSEHSNSSSATPEGKHNPPHHHQHQSRVAMHAANSGGNGNGGNNGNNGNGPGGILGTRTIGDLVSGEIERTLEISNQTLINAAVNMNMNMNMGPRPDNSFSPINRPASVEGESNLSTLAHVASYAPAPSVTPTSTPSPAISRSSVLYPPQQNQPQR